MTNKVRRNKVGSRVIALEEHYSDPRFGDLRQIQPARVVDRLLDLEDLRLKEMDEGGIDIQVLSHAPPGAQALSVSDAVSLTHSANDFLHEAVKRHPTRYAAFASLPTIEPIAAADELERTVYNFGFKGAMVHGLTRGLFFDDKRFWPILERAQALDVPIYLHPATPHPAVIQAYYADRPVLTRAGWGFGVECATQVMRMIVSGVFDAYPRLKIILGHLGEGLPFLLWRTDAILSRESTLPRSVRDYFCGHFYVTTSGNFSGSALQCTLAELGADSIMFSVDWPWATNIEGISFIEGFSADDTVKKKILHQNAERLLRL